MTRDEAREVTAMANYMIMLPDKIDTLEIQALFERAGGMPIDDELKARLKIEIIKIIRNQVEPGFTPKEFWAAHWLTIRDDGFIGFVVADSIFGIIPPEQRFYAQHKPIK